jgi:ATP-binding cassette subfamily B protein
MLRNTVRSEIGGQEAGTPPCVVLETNIGLDGNAASQLLEIDNRKLVARDEHGNNRREWRLSDIDGFRIEPSLGSCFLQARVAGQWVDLIRRPGGVDQQVTESLSWLDACRREVGRNGRPLARLDAASSAGPSDNRPPPRSSRRWRTMVQLLALLRPFRGSVLLLIALSLGAVTVEVLPPLLQGYLVDHVLQPEIAKDPQAQLVLLLAAIVAGLLLVRLAATLVGIWKGRVSSRVGTSMTANLRNDLVRKLNELPLNFYDKNQVGMLMSQVAYDTETLHTLVYHATSGVLLQSLQLAGISVMLIYLNPRLALISLIPMPLIIAGSWYFTRCLQPRHHHYWEAVGKQAAALMGMLSGIRVVKSFVQEDREIRRFDESSRRLRDSRFSVDTSTSTFAAAIGFLFAIGTLAAWFLGGRDVLFGQMTLGALTAFLQYLAMFYAPLTSIAESTTWFANFFSVSRRICDLLDTPSESGSPRPQAARPPFQGRVELRDVSFGYDKSRPVLHDIGFTVEPGEMVGVVGRSGSGKSTLVNLIARLYDVDAGQVLVDGVDVREMDLRQLRRHVGMVPQEPFLFRGSIADNVAYGNAQAAPGQILLAARQADAHDFIMRMPLAYSTQLGEGGSGLSGGERQRLSIARALLFNPTILILDEATASVDAESERSICRAIRRWARAPCTHGRRTAIVIAHRLSTLQDADRLLVFDQGRLIEQGTQPELLARGGLYSRLLRLQQGSVQEDGRFGDPVVAALATSGAETVAFHADGDGAAFSSQAPRGRVPSRSISRDATEEGDDYGLRWLDPGVATITGGSQATLCLRADGENIDNAYAVCALPAAYEQRYISLRRCDSSGHEQEVGLIASLADWPRVVQEAVCRSLRRRYLMRQVREIRQIGTSGNQLVLSVRTDSATVDLRLEKPGEGSQPFGNNGMLLTDASGSYYIIPDRGALPKWQQRLLTLYFGD